jgi:hypothetical protein
MKMKFFLRSQRGKQIYYLVTYCVLLVTNIRWPSIILLTVPVPNMNHYSDNFLPSKTVTNIIVLNRVTTVQGRKLTPRHNNILDDVVFQLLQTAAQTITIKYSRDHAANFLPEHPTVVRSFVICRPKN